MTIVEVMISAVIFFIVLTAILGLTTLSTNMGIQAKRNSVLTNVVNSYIERVQAMPFEDVEVGTAEGQLASMETTTVEEYTVVIEPTVSAGTTGLKELHIEVTLTVANGQTQSTSTTVVIRDKTRFLTQSVEGGSQITWNELIMPPLNEVVYGASWASGNVLQIAASATALEGRTIESVVVKAGGYPLRDTAGNQAIWSVTASTIASGTQEWVMPYFVWDTLQKDPVDALDPPTMEPTFLDGRQTLTIVVTDSEGVEARSNWTLLLDNYAPDNPAPPTASNTALGQSTVSWSTVMDGVLIADGYKLTVLQQQLGGTWSEAPAQTVPGATTTWVMDTGSFSRYYARLRAISPRGLSSETTGMANSWITRPGTSGSAATSAVGQPIKYVTTVDLHVDSPTFAVTGGVTYQWEQAESLAGPWTSIPNYSTVQNPTVSYEFNNLNQIQAYYYRCLVSFTPGIDCNGVEYSTPSTLGSTVVGPTSKVVQGSTLLTERWPQ
ncbi:MAG: hypothetical protein Q7J82_04235 [Coriobacteriia bacterium]|nr:hypothetical protein [Coriobacteriia bacterium]